MDGRRVGRKGLYRLLAWRARLFSGHVEIRRGERATGPHLERVSATQFGPPVLNCERGAVGENLPPAFPPEISYSSRWFGSALAPDKGPARVSNCARCGSRQASEGGHDHHVASRLPEPAQ